MGKKDNTPRYLRWPHRLIPHNQATGHGYGCHEGHFLVKGWSSRSDGPRYIQLVLFQSLEKLLLNSLSPCETRSLSYCRLGWPGLCVFTLASVLSISKLKNKLPSVKVICSSQKHNVCYKLLIIWDFILNLVLIEILMLLDWTSTGLLYNI